jgi:preprotein translocase subunit YajC
LNPFATPFLAQAAPEGAAPPTPEAAPQPPESTSTTQQVNGSAAPPPGDVVKKDPPGLFSGPWIPLLLGIVVLYFFVFRSKRNEDRKRQEMLAALKRGDRVVTIGGIIGNVIEANDQNVLLKVDESSNTKMRFTRSAIHRVLTDEKTEAK